MKPKLFLSLFCLLLLTACPSPPKVSDAISNITPNPVTMTGSSIVNPTTTLSFQNSSNNTISYSIEESLDWLEIVTGASGSLAAGKTARIKLEATCTTTTSLSGTITIVSGSERKPVDIQLSCQSTAPNISEPTPGILTFSGSLGREFTTSFSFDSTGDEDLTYTIKETASWLEVTSNPSGTLAPENSVTVGLKATCPDTEDEYTTTILIDSNASDQTVNFVLTCSSTPLPGISEANPSTITLSGALGQKLTSSFSFDSTGDINLIYSVREDASWLEVTSNPSGTVVPDDSVTVGLRATCPATELSETTTVTIDSNAPDQIVNITLNCSGSPVLADISPNPLALSGQTGNSTSSTFSLQNLGGADLTYSISSNQSWLTVSPVSGTVDPASTQLINLTATCPAIAGAQSATLTITSNDANKPSTTLLVNLTCSSNVVSEFSIQLQYVGTLSAAQRNAVEKAAERWAKIIVGDLPNRPFSKAFNICGIQDPKFDGLIDDVVIAVTIGTIDGTGQVMADAGPCGIRDNSLPFYSTIKLDAADIASFVGDDLDELMLREIGRALGFGSLWAKLNKVSYNPSASACNTLTSFSTRPTFNGPTAKTRYNDLGGAGNPPVEDGINAEVRCSSWDENIFDNELMTSVFDLGKANILSLVTIAAMQDIGYETDPSQATPYELPDCSPTCLQAPTGFYDMVRSPVIDQFGLRLK